jgi:hypothetical protein
MTYNNINYTEEKRVSIGTISLIKIYMGSALLIRQLRITGT